MVYGTTAAHAVDYIYNIINNSGELVMRVKDTNGNAKLIATARTPFAKDYRYYKTLAEAQADAQYGRNEAVASHGAIAYDENTSFSTITSSGALEKEGSASLIYVRYSYNPSATTIIDTEGNVLDITGKSSYNLEIEGYKGSKNVALRKCYYYNGLDAAIVWKYSNVVTDDERKSPAYRWFYIGAMAGYEGAQGNPDPYDIKIENAAGRSANHSYVVSGHYDKPMPYTGFGTNQHINCYYSADNANTNNIYRFFIRVVTGSQPNSVQLAAAEPCFIFKSASNSWFVLNSEEDNDTYKPYMHFRLHGNHELGNNATNVRAHCMFTKAKAGHKYVIVGSDGTERARANAPIDEDIELKVPDAISTIVPVTYHYFTSKDNATNYYTNSGGETNEITVLPSTNETIYVSYDYDASKNGLVKLDGSAKYIVAINDRYVKYDKTGFQGSHVVEGNKDDAEDGHDEYIWRTKGEDPYGIFVQNEKAGNGFYFTGTGTSAIEIRTSGEGAAVQATDSYDDYVPGRYFLVKSPLYTETHPLFLFRAVYTSEADDNQYTWGYHATEGCSFLSSSNVDDDADAIQMQIYELRDNQVTYHIIDKQGKEVVSASNNKVYCVVPDEIFSPLVSRYHYYPSSAFTENGGVYTLADANKEITDRMTTGHNDIYVTYDTGTEIDLSGVEYKTTEGADYGKYTDETSRDKKKYMIRFLNGQSYYQEDGKDGLTHAEYLHSNSYFDTSEGGPGAGTYKAEYVYVNGDGNLNVYCDFLREKQFDKAANERTRWSWYIIGDHGTGNIDPYHVTIQAGSNTSHTNKGKSDDDNVNANYYASLRTYYNETLGAVITSTISNDSIVKLKSASWPKGSNVEDGGSDDHVPTEYMLLGKKGKYRLVTSQPIGDGTTSEHRTVNSLEQYWKNYDLIRKNYFKLSNEKLRADTALTEAQENELTDRGWHKYKAWANAVPWDGMKTGSTDSKDKKYVYSDHWYQTFEIGDEFDLIEVKPDPAVVLIDKHGWEVFRHPMPTTKNGDGDKDKAIFIKSYDSPMVTYHWYKKATKDTGCHRYALSDPAMTEDGSAEYTSESLLQFPPHYGQNAGDWYVSYEVKPDYKDIYHYNGTTGTSAPVLIKQNDMWATAASASAIGSVSGSTVTIDKTNKEEVTITGTITNDMLWYLAPGDLEDEMGYPNDKDTITFKNDQLCFDPYNVQIKSASNSEYFKTAATNAELKDGQHWLGKPPYNIGLGTNTEATGMTNTEGFDHTTVKITNATFMVIQDAQGNLRFCPRFDNESAVTNLTGVSPNVTAWIYDNTRDNVSFDPITQLYTITANKTDCTSQAIELYPLQQYQFHIRNLNDGGSAPDVVTSDTFYAIAGTSLIHQLSNLTAPLPVEYIRAYCEYQGAFTNFDSSTNTYSGEVTSYPPGTENGIELTHIYVPYTVVSTAAFFNTEAEAVASNNWMFLLQGTESVATIFGKKLIDYGMEVRYGFRDAAQSEDIGPDMPDLTPAERSFVWNSGKYGGFHFLRRGGTPTVNVNTGAMTFAEGQENVLAAVGGRYFASKDTTASVYLLSPLNDFRRIAETYTDGKETGFRESSWLWAFIGTPYKFYAINREDALARAEGSRKRLAVAAKTSGKELLVLTDQYQTGEPYNPRQAGAYWFTMSKYAVQTDEEAANTFALQLWDGDNIEKNDSCIGKASNANEFVKAPKNLIKKGTADQPDIAVMKVSSFRAYPWNWDDKKYQKVTVNIYPGTEENHGPLALTKTYERSDRAFIAGDVIDGTDGHFYLPIEAQEDGSWKPDGVVTNTVPYDHHLINIPYELRRRFCKYTVQGGSYTVELDDSEDPEPQVINIYYTVDTDNAPLFVSEDELESFRSYIKADAEGIFKNGKKYSDYFYFLDQNWQLSKHLYINTNNKGNSEATRFSATNDPKQLMWYFVGDPYNVRLFNVYTDLNSSETRNFVRHRYADKTHSTGYDSNAANDNNTFMEQQTNKMFYWELVDTWVGLTAKGELDSTHVNVSFRKNLLKGKPFAMRMKVTTSENPTVISDATYYYMKHDKGQTGGMSIYNKSDGGSLSPKLNELDAYANFPDSRHKANDRWATLTPLKPTKVKVTVFDPDEPTRKVTEDEVSDYFALTDHFKGVPDNLQRKHCEYWWVSTDPDPKATNMVDENLYYTVTEENPHIYVRYRETDDSPFSQLVDGKPVLKRNAALNPWYNMNIGGWWAFFNSSLDGKTYLVSGTTPNEFNNSTLSFVYKGSTLPNSTDKFHKGLQWALIGDPYNFTLRNNRDRMESESLSSNRTAAYINDTSIGTDGTVWTWLRNGVKNESGKYEYFLSESAGRRTEVVASNSSGAKGFGAPRRILPSDYTISAQSETRNFTVADNNGTSSITTGDNYTIGSNMWLLSVNDAAANNESFDAIVNVYNKMNELVATTGWTELARNNAEWNGSLPVDVRRWGCTYHYWADETMTRYPFHTYDQTDDGQPKNDNNNYLVQDGSTIYVTYDYDESLYSSENEYRWVNLFFNWDDEHKEWTKDPVTEKLYTAEFWEYNTETGEFERRRNYDVYKTQDQWVEHHLYTDTQEGWVESPKETGTYDKNKAYAYYDKGQYTDKEQAKNQKWAMIGDPYKFILYNYNRKAEAGAKNSYYLYRNKNGNVIESKNFSSYAPFTKDTYEGLYWTWKVDGTRFTFAEGDETNHTTTYGPREGLPQSFYQDYADATKAGATNEEKKAGFSIETGYLANCKMQDLSLYDKNNLVGSVLGYVSYKHKYLVTTEKKDGTGEEASQTYVTGTKDKFYEYKDSPVYDDDKDRNYTTDETVIIQEVPAVPAEGNNPGSDGSPAVTFSEKWKAVYGDNNLDENGRYASGEFKGYYPGPTSSLQADRYQEHTTYKSVQDYNIATVAQNEQSLTLESNLIDIANGTIHIPRFLVMPMAAQAKSITFHLDTKTYSDGSTAQSLRTADNIVYDHTSENYGVGNTLALPWMMRRQYCDYKFYLVEAADDGTLATRRTENKIDDLTHADNAPSNTHRLANRSGDAYTTFWSGGTDLSSDANCYITQGEGASAYHEYVVPQSWADKDVFILVRYKPTAEFEAMKSTSTDGSIGENSTVNWVNIMNVENGNMMRYTRSGNVTGESRDSLNDVTNDYLWAIEGDPYGFKLHNRYADHGFDGTLNEKWTTLLTTGKVNSTEKYNYSMEENSHFTFDANDDPVMKSDITYGATGTADAYGMMSTTTTNAVYEAMMGNYDKGMLIHPVNACINIRNQNGYKYYGAFMFNGAPTGDPVQLNYMQDWEVMRNVYANWQFVKPAAKQFLPYYNRAGFVGGLKTDVAAAANNKAIFDKIAAGTTLDDTEYNTVWSLVQNPANLVPFESGKFYRLKAYSAGNGVVGGDYVSGYLHKTELVGEKPLHIYGKAGVASNISSLLSYEGNEWAADVANKSLLEIPDIEFDPSSIFRVTCDGEGYVKMETQGLVVSDSKMMAEPDEPTPEQTESMLFQMQDIGQTAFQMRTKAHVTGENAETSYLSCNPSTLKYGLNTEANELNIASGISSGNTVKTHDTKWLLEPVGTTATNASGNVYQHALRLKLTSFNDNIMATSFCVPYDITLPEGVDAYASGAKEDVEGGMHYHGTLSLNKIEGNIAAGTPVIIKTTKDKVDVNNAIEILVPCIDPSPRTDNGFFSINYLTGVIDHVFDGKETVCVFGKSGGKPIIYRNASKNYDGLKDNHFLAHHKIYVILTDEAVAQMAAKGFTLSFDETPLTNEDVTGVDVVGNEEINKNNDTIYDIQGRKVEYISRPGIYIRNGKKFVVRKGQY